MSGRARDFRRQRDEHDPAVRRVLAAIEVVDAGRPHVFPGMGGASSGDTSALHVDARHGCA